MKDYVCKFWGSAWAWKYSPETGKHPDIPSPDEEHHSGWAEYHELS